MDASLGSKMPSYRKKNKQNECKVYDKFLTEHYLHVDGLVQECSISSVLPMQLLWSSTKPLIYG